VASAAHENGVLCKVIIETALLTDGEKVSACLAAKNAGADFVKTSTDFQKAGQTVEDIALMRRTVGSALGVKASGGVKGIDDARAMFEAGATRIRCERRRQDRTGSKRNQIDFRFNQLLKRKRPPHREAFSVRAHCPLYSVPALKLKL
jgi:hypothetical protein